MKHIMTYQQSEQGRSMVEMLGTLAIMGALSVGAIGGYSYAMNKHRTNELIYEATKRAQWVGTQLEMNKNAQNIGFGGFGTDTFGGGKFTGTVKTDLANPNQFGIVVSGLKEAVCENIVKSLQAETNGVVRAVKTTDGTTDFDRDNCDENAEFLLVFNRDLSVNDSEITPSESEVSGEVSAQASVATEATATQNPDDEHCNGNGSWNGSSCYCDNGWQGDNCSEEEPEETETGTSGSDPEESIATEATEAGDDAECNYNGVWNGSYCECNSGWGGSDCSQTARAACADHGSWIVSSGGNSYCSCDSSWGGSDCSIENACSGQGYWLSDKNWCECNSGWGGSDCSMDSNTACNGRGVWVGNVCVCDSGWYGATCSTQDISGTCNNHGVWELGQCECESGYGGKNCSVENPCNSHGIWIVDTSRPNSGFCECDLDYTGTDCSIPQ